MKIIQIIVLTAPLILLGCNMPKNVEMGNQALALSKTEVVELEKRATDGDGEAALQLSRYYGFVVQDEKLDEHWLRIAANSGHVGAQTGLATLLLAIGGLENNSDAIYYLDLAAEAGSSQAQYDLAELLESRNRTPNDLARAREMYLRAAQHRTFRPMFKAGTYLVEGIGGPTKNLAGLSWLLKARELVPQSSGSYLEVSEAIQSAKNRMSRQEVATAQSMAKTSKNSDLR